MARIVLLFLFCCRVFGASFTVGTYNLEFYVDRPTLNVPPKSEAARKTIREMIRRLDVDVLALQEMGGTNALLELRSALEADGFSYPHWSHVAARDTNLHLAFLSKFRIVAAHHKTNENFLHQGRRFFVGRGFGEIEIELPNKMRVTFITAHLKSKRLIAEADQQDLREEEALLLRAEVDRWLAANPEGNLIVLGDMNDGVESKTIRTIIGRGKRAMWDIRPREGGGKDLSKHHARDIVWTHYYAKEEIYSRIDYIFVSPALRAALDHNGCFIVTSRDWANASDHRPIRAAFQLN